MRRVHKPVGDVTVGVSIIFTVYEMRHTLNFIIKYIKSILKDTIDLAL